MFRVLRYECERVLDSAQSACFNSVGQYDRGAIRAYNGEGSMAKKARSKAKTQAEMDEIERDRLAAHEVGLTHEQAIQGANLASGVPDPIMGISSGEEHREDADTAMKTAELLAEEQAEYNDAGEYETVEEAAAGGEPEEGEGETKESVSIVKDKFKEKYIENAKALGVPGKAAKRSNWDWLSQQLATFCLNDKHSIDIGAFKDVLDANGVDHSRWTNQNRGWEGRFRMTGRVALQKVVANSGVLKWPTGEPTVAPPEFIEKYKTKA